MSLAFNTITTGKLALFVLSALIKGISSGRMASLSFSNSGKWHVKEEIASHPTTHLHETFFKPNFQGCLHFCQAMQLGLGLSGCDYLSLGSRAGVGWDSLLSATGGPLVGKSAHLHLS